jgi:hypothetical protein
MPASAPTLPETVEFPAALCAWLDTACAEHMERWRMEIASGLRDEEGRLTCANLHDPAGPLAEAERVAEALMQPRLRQWLATPVHELLRRWRAQK